MKWCPNCGKELEKDGFCSNCGSNSVMPGIRYNTEKESQLIKQSKKQIVSDNKKQIEKQIKENKYCRSCGKKLNKNGICKECESSTFMPGIDERDKYKFCGNCGQELNEDGICKNCGIKNNIDTNEISANTGISSILSVFSIIIFFSPLILRLNIFSIPVIIAFILVIIAKIIDHKNTAATVVMVIEIILIILMIIGGILFNRMIEGCKGLNN